MRRSNICPMRSVKTESASFGSVTISIERDCARWLARNWSRPLPIAITYTVREGAAPCRAARGAAISAAHDNRNTKNRFMTIETIITGKKAAPRRV
jgi:hypothetical protein